MFPFCSSRSVEQHTTIRIARFYKSTEDVTSARRRNRTEGGVVRFYLCLACTKEIIAIVFALCRCWLVAPAVACRHRTTTTTTGRRMAVSGGITTVAAGIVRWLQHRPVECKGKIFYNAHSQLKTGTNALLLLTYIGECVRSHCYSELTLPGGFR